jgi:hypothetical protein
MEDESRGTSERRKREEVEEGKCCNSSPSLQSTVALSIEASVLFEDL